jgi:23S rRNA (guanine745-N1)-methyltransferase
METLLLCPHCGAPLTKKERQLLCPLSHSFDLSKSGYVNLLLGGGAHGDNREMIAARTRFLDGGHYSPLREALCRLAKVGTGGVLVDAGCGEGYYTESLAKHFSHTVGFDLSKDALKKAAKRVKDAEFAVASVYDLPFPDEGADLVSCIFAPLALSEYTRVLKKGGFLLLAIPDEEHLFSLKAILYDTPYKNEVADTALAGFTLLENQALSFPLELGNTQAIEDLFKMTPYYYRTPEAGKERLLSLPALRCTAAFRLLLYKKN